jgi:hypothetical protein
MSAGISRTHGTAVLPFQRPSTLSFFNVSLPNANITADAGVVDGAFDQMFRTAVGKFATVGLVGTPAFTGGNTVLNFAIEDTGATTDANHPAASGLGLGQNGASPTTTAAALQAAIRALGTSVGSGARDLSTATVSLGVVASSSANI